jgi:phage shock protein A
MGIFARLAALIKSNLNDLISKAEDPVKMLDQVVIDMANQLIEAKKQVAVAIAEEKKLAKQAEVQAAQAAEWERRAMMAVRAGDDTLAKEALARKRELDGRATEFKELWSRQKKQVDQLKLALRLLNNKIEEAKRKKDVLKARARAAEAHKKIQETMAGLNNASAFETFARMEQKVMQIEGEAEAAAELAEEYSGDTLAHKFQKLEVTAGADDDLAALKRQMGLAPAPAPAPPPEAAPVRVAQQADAPVADISPEEHDELAAALAELEAQEQAEQARMKR